MQPITLIQIPYDSGHLSVRMGTGPYALTARGLGDQSRLRADFETVAVHLPEGFHTEMSALIHLQHAATTAARDAIRRGRRPIFLSGNCGPAALSAIGALGANQTSIIWFDAHADCNTPETSPSGFLDGMCVALLTGQCWRKVADRLDNVRPVPCDQIIQIGVRHLDPEEKALLESLMITQINSDQLDRLPDAIGRATRRSKSCYVQLDADVLEFAEG